MCTANRFSLTNYKRKYAGCILVAAISLTYQFHPYVQPKDAFERDSGFVFLIITFVSCVIRNKSERT